MITAIKYLIKTCPIEMFLGITKKNNLNLFFLKLNHSIFCYPFGETIKDTVILLTSSTNQTRVSIENITRMRCVKKYFELVLSVQSKKT